MPILELNRWKEVLEALSQEKLYKWFTQRPIQFPADHRILEIFLISHFDDSLKATRMTKAQIRVLTGLSKYLLNRYIEDLSLSNTWLITREGKSHTYLFVPKVESKEN